MYGDNRRISLGIYLLDKYRLLGHATTYVNLFMRRCDVYRRIKTYIYFILICVDLYTTYINTTTYIDIYKVSIYKTFVPN